jgi:hypothetical protein
VVAAGGLNHHILPESGWISFYLREPADVERAIACSGSRLSWQSSNGKIPVLNQASARARRFETPGVLFWALVGIKEHKIG